MTKSSRHLAVAALTAVTLIAVVPGAFANDSQHGGGQGQARDSAPIPERARQTLLRATSISSANPDEFGGAWYDTAIERVHIGVVDGASPEVPDDLDAVTVVVKRSETALLALLPRVYDLPTADRSLLSYADIDFAANQVVAAANEVTEELIRAAREAHGDAVTLVTGPAVSTQRKADTSAFSGGALIGMKKSPTQVVSSLSICSSGFSWRSSSGAHQMITAGHCVPQGTSTPSVNTNALPNYSYELGRVRSSSYLNGTGSVLVNGASVGDLAVVDVALLKSSAPRIYAGSATSAVTIPVVRGNYEAQPPGEAYEVSGQTTGVTGVWLVKAENSSYKDSNTGDVISPVVRGEKEGQCTRGGDSGGPTYTPLSSNTQAVVRGIHSGGGGGGSDSFGGAFDPCIEFYSKLSGVRAAFGGSLALS